MFSVSEYDKAFEIIKHAFPNLSTISDILYVVVIPINKNDLHLYQNANLESLTLFPNNQIESKHFKTTLLYSHCIRSCNVLDIAIHICMLIWLK